MSFFFSLNQIVGDVENAFINNFDTEEKVSSLEQVFSDFILLGNMFTRFQSDPQTVSKNGMILYHCIDGPSIIISFSVPDFNLRSLVLDQESFLVDLQDFLQSKNISVDSSNLQTLTQLNFQLASITRGMLSY